MTDDDISHIDAGVRAALQAQPAAEPVATYADKLHRAMRWYDSGAEDRNEFARLITDLLEHTTPQTTPDCRTCQHLSNVWGVCESRPKCVGGDQYVYFAEKQLWDTTPRNDGQAAHQEMREAIYAEFNPDTAEAIRLALEALNSCTPGDWSTGHVIDPYFDEKLVDAAIAALEKVVKP